MKFIFAFPRDPPDGFQSKIRLKPGELMLLQDHLLAPSRARPIIKVDDEVKETELGSHVFACSCVSVVVLQIPMLLS